MSYLQSDVEGMKSPRLCHGEPLYAQSLQLAEYFSGSLPSAIPYPHVILSGLSYPFQFPLAFIDLLELPSPLYLDGHCHLMDVFGCKVSFPYLTVQRYTFIYIIYSPLTLFDPLGYL